MTTEAVVEGDGGAVAAGEQLRNARQGRNLGQQQVANQLRVPVHVIAALEDGQWERLGAPVFIRGQLRSYARLLQIDPDPLIALVAVEPLAPVALVSHAGSSGLGRHVGGLGRKSLYVLQALVLIVLLVFGLKRYLQPATASAAPDPVAPATLPVPVTPTAADSQTALPLPAVQDTAPAVPQVQPVGGQSTAASGMLVLRFDGQSWIEVTGRQGQVVEKALVLAGQQRSYPAASIGHVLLGNATGVQASIDGRAIDLTKMGRSNVARFTVSSDGSVSPVSN